MPAIHQEITFEASPARVYRALMDSAEHAKFTGAPAEISPDEGGAFACYGGRVLGRNVQLVPNVRIVQAWRAADWPDGVYSVARYELRADGKQTRLTFDHDGVPAAAVEHIEPGWKKMYWEPLRRYLQS